MKSLFPLAALGLLLLLAGCASTPPRSNPQWIVVSTNAPAPRLSAVGVPVSPSTNATAAGTHLLDLVAGMGVSTELLSRIAENKPLTLPDLEELAQKKVDDEVILNYLRGLDTVYVLRASELEQMRQAGVSDRILDHLLATRLQPTIIPYERPSAYPGNYYYHDPFWYSPAYRPYYYHHRHYHPRSVIRKK